MLLNTQILFITFRNLWYRSSGVSIPWIWHDDVPIPKTEAIIHYSQLAMICFPEFVLEFHIHDICDLTLKNFSSGWSVWQYQPKLPELNRIHTGKIKSTLSDPKHNQPFLCCASVFGINCYLWIHNRLIKMWNCLQLPTRQVGHL